MAAPNIVIRLANEIVASRGVKVLVHSDTGVGKTFAIPTAPRPFGVTAEHGLLSIRKSSVPFVEIKTMADLGNVYQWLTESADAKYIDTICIDSWSEIAETFLAEIMPRAKDPRQAYFECQNRVIEMTKAFRDIPDKNLYITAKTEMIKDEATGALKWSPMMPGTKLSQLLPYLFDEVWAIRLSTAKDPATGQNYRYFQTQPDLQYMAKDRSGALAAQEPANLTHCFTKMRS